MDQQNFEEQSRKFHSDLWLQYLLFDEVKYNLLMYD